MTTHYPDGPEPTSAELLTVLADVVSALGRAQVPYAVMGGLGNATMARPRSTDDIDLFVRPDDAHAALEALADAGFDIEEHDPSWLFKAHKHGVLVDIIFRSSGDIYLDDEMLQRSKPGRYKDITVPVIAPEDLLVIKAVAASEETMHHWYDALGIIARCDLDWPYLLGRARQAGPRRVLSLLLYAESNDLAVPADAVAALFSIVHSSSGRAAVSTP